MPDLKTAEWLIVFSTLIAPVLAVQAQKFIERIRAKRQQKLSLFGTLMATRAARVSPDHVRALNMIDLEFYGRKVFGFRSQRTKDKRVIDSWRVYHDHLIQQVDQNAPDAIRLWLVKGDELFTDLLYKMSIALGYTFDIVHLKRGIYQPRAHDEQEIALRSIRDNLAKILSGQASLPMSVTSFPVSQEALDQQRNFQQAMIDFLSNLQAKQAIGTIESRANLDSNKLLNTATPPESVKG